MQVAKLYIQSELTEPDFIAQLMMLIFAFSSLLIGLVKFSLEETRLFGADYAYPGHLLTSIWVPSFSLLWVCIHGTQPGFHLLCEVLPYVPGSAEPAFALIYPSTN